MKERDRTLSEIMNSLREGYNPNYQDMAVLEAVRGWEAIEGLPHIGTDEEPPKQETSEEEEVEEGAWTEDQLEHQLDGLIEQDYLSLLLSHESYLETTGGSPLMEISSYLPDSWLPVYVSIRTGLLQILHTVGIITGSASREKSEQAAAALQGFNDAESELSRLHRQKGDTTKTLGELLTPNTLVLRVNGRNWRTLALNGNRETTSTRFACSEVLLRRLRMARITISVTSLHGTRKATWAIPITTACSTIPVVRNVGMVRNEVLRSS